MSIVKESDSPYGEYGQETLRVLQEALGAAAGVRDDHARIALQLAVRALARVMGPSALKELGL